MLALIGTALAVANPKSGSACPKAGQTIGSGAQKLKCELVWVSTASKNPAASTNTTSSTNPNSNPNLQKSKDFVLVSVNFADDGTGDVGGVARITNTARSTKTGSFTITLFDSSGTNVIATLTGSAEAVDPGNTITVQFISLDPVPSGQFKYQFQTDLEY